MSRLLLYNAISVPQKCISNLPIRIPILKDCCNSLCNLNTPQRAEKITLCLSCKVGQCVNPLSRQEEVKAIFHSLSRWTSSECLPGLSGQCFNRGQQTANKWNVEGKGLHACYSQNLPDVSFTLQKHRIIIT